MNGFRDREEAGRRLAVELRSYAFERPIVLALPRGGVPVGCEIARALHAPLDAWVVRKIGVPWCAELGVGAVAEQGYLYLDEELLGRVGLTPGEVGKAVRSAQHEVEDGVRLFRRGRERPILRNHAVIVVDDGVETGCTVRAAVRSIRAHGPKAMILAVPVAAAETIRSLASEVDCIVCLRSPSDLDAIGRWYVDFEHLSNEDVLGLLGRARKEREEEHLHMVHAAA